jgi:phage portal protein BeeE
VTLLGRLAQAASPNLGDPSHVLDPDSVLWLDAFFGRRSTAGKTVTVETAVGIPTVWACLRILTDAIGSMPLETFERTGGGGQQEAFATRSGSSSATARTREMTGTLLWRLVMLHLNTWGNAYLGKKFATAARSSSSGRSGPTASASRARSGVKQFFLRDAYGRELPDPYTQGEIIHIQGISFDGLMGLSPIEAAREAFGLGLALEEYTNRSSRTARSRASCCRRRRDR